MFTVTWHYAESTPLTQGGFATREHAEQFIQYVESSRHRKTHTHATIEPAQETASMTNATQCPTTGCSNDLLPDQTECIHCTRARIEFDSAGFTIRANYYADGLCIECGETVEAGDYCHEHAQDHVPEDVKAMQQVRTCQVCGDVNVMSTNTLCVSCHRTLYPGELDSTVQAAARRLGLVAAILIALFLFTPTTHAAAYTPTAPVGCHITHFWQDDLSAIAVCIGGYTITKEDGPTDTWNDVLFATGVMLVGPDANGEYHEYVTFD